ncbi:OLC1v1030712C1 [Oldenlandia corymbosa var. corymbosa]|uniref:OLC1v1030712C1 n=1 Tax=Oldenlandia corymbosa var. corymbosa TaxID=529605 RepID=A0AAV1CJM4_OLDCO|nr:OLC1v1030712C1 [Oldenlandia corymbosa var. corymbosa]
MSLPQSSATAHSTGHSSIPIQAFASGGSSLAINTLLNISAVDSYSILTTNQSTVIRQQSSQQQSNVGSEIEHAMATQVEHFEDAFQRLIGHNTNIASCTLSRSMTSGVNTAATVAVSLEVPPVSMVNNPLYHAIFQDIRNEYSVRNLERDQVMWNSQGNFTFDGRQLPPLSPPYGTPVMMLGTSWGQQLPYQRFQAPWPVTPGMQEQVLPMQHRKGSAVVPSQLSGQEGAPRLTYIPQGTTDVGVQATAGVTINQGPVGTGNNQGAVIENARQTGQHVSGIVVADPQIVPPHQTLEENREEQQWMEYEANQILNRNRAQAIGRHIRNQNLGNRHNPRHQHLWGHGGGRQQVDLGNEVRQEPDAAANDNQQQNFETGVHQILNAEDVFSRMIEDKIHKELGREIPEIPGKPCPGYVEWEPLPRNFKIPDFQQFSGEDEKRPEDHIKIRQKFGETAKAYLIRFRQMYAKIPDKYDEPTIFKMAIAGIQDYKVKLGVTPHSLRPLNHLADIVRRCEKVIKDKREKNPGKTKQWFNKAPIAEVNQNQWVHDEDDDEYEVNTAEIVNVRNYTCDALRRPTVPHSYNTPPPVGAPAGTSGQAGGANIGRAYSFDISQQEAIFYDMFQKGHIQYRGGYRQPKPADLVGKTYSTEFTTSRFECRSSSDAATSARTRLGNIVVNPKANSPYQVHDTRPSVWQRIQRSSQRDKTEPRSVRAAPVYDREWHHTVHPKSPTPPLRKEKMTRTQKQRWQRVVNKQNRGATGKLGTVQEEQPLLSQQASMNKFSGQEDRRSQLWRKVDMFFPPVNMVYMLSKNFRRKEPATATTIILKTVANSLVVPKAASFVTVWWYSTVISRSEVGPYCLIGMDKYGRPQQATMRRDMSLPEWKLLLQEVNRPYNYNMLRPLPDAPSIEEVFNEDN